MALGPNLVHPAIPGQPVPITWTSGFAQAYAITAPAGMPSDMPSDKRMPLSFTCSYPAWPAPGVFLFLFHFICQVPQNSSSHLSGTIFLNALKLKLSEPRGEKKKKRISSHNDDKTSNTAANAARILNKEGQLLPQTWVLSNEPNWQATYSEFTFGNTTWLGGWNFQRSHKDVWKVAAVLKLEALAFWGACGNQSVSHLPLA